MYFVNKKTGEELAEMSFEERRKYAEEFEAHKRGVPGV
jgi:hypothetical protein